MKYSHTDKAFGKFIFAPFLFNLVFVAERNRDKH